MKKKLIVCLSMMMVVTLLVACGGKTSNVDSDDKDVNDSVNYDEYYYWKDNIISGLTDEGKKQKTLVIPERCTKIDVGAFTFDTYLEPNKTVEKVVFQNPDTQLESGLSNFIKLKEIELPNHLKTLPSNCFTDCESLETIELPDSLEMIPEYAFCDCTSLKKIEISENVQSIGQSAFMGCENLEEVTFNSKLENIGADAFYNCAKLQKIELNEGVKEIGATAFTGCDSLTDIYLPASIESIDGTALAQLSAQHVTVWVKEGSYIDNIFAEEFGSIDGLEKKYY